MSDHKYQQFDQYQQQQQYAPQQQQQQPPQYQQYPPQQQQQQQYAPIPQQQQQPVVIVMQGPPPPPVTIQTTQYQEHGGPCSTVMNILWIIFGGGIVMFLLWGVFGCLLAITIIGIPVAKQFWKLALLSLLPFGRVVNYGENKCPQLCGNLLWLPFGLMIALFHLMFGLVMLITIIGIPFGLQHFKLAKLALWPCGADIATSSVASQTLTTVSHV